MTEAEFKKKVEQAMEEIEKEKEKKEFKGFAKQVDEYAKQSGNSVVYLEALTHDAECGNVSKYINGKTDEVISMLIHALEKIIARKFPRGHRMPAIILISEQLMKALDDNE